MFDPDRPDEARRNRSLLSFRRDGPSADDGPDMEDDGAEAPPRDGREDAASAHSSVRPESAPHPHTVVVEEEQHFADDDRWRPLIDPGSVIGGVVRAKWLIVATTLAGAIIGVMIALDTPKEYYAATELLIDPRDLSIVERELTRGGLPSDATLALVENQVRVLTSGTVLTKAVERLDLQDDPEFNGEEPASLTSLLTSPRALLSLAFGQGGGEEGPGAAHREAVETLADSLEVERGNGTFIVTVGVTTKDGEKSARIADAVVEAFLETSGDLQARTATRATGELTGRLDDMRARVGEAEQAVADYKSEHDIVDAQGRRISEDEISSLSERLSQARAHTAELTARADSAGETEVEDILGGTLPEQVDSPVLTELLAQHAAQRRQAERLSSRLGPLHPERVTFEAEMAGTREEMARELRRVTSSMQVELTRAIQTEQALADRLAELKVAKGDLEDEEVELRQLERQAAASRAVYESFLLRAQQTGQQSQLNTANISVISQAYAPREPVGPSRSAIAITGMVLGFIAGVGLGAAGGVADSLRRGLGRPPRRQHRPAPQRRPEPRPAPAPRPEAVPQPEAAPAATATAHHDPAPPASAERAADGPVDDLRANLRAFRRELDELAATRARRRAG